MTNEPRANFCAAASNGSSATWMSASFELVAQRDRARCRALWLIANTRARARHAARRLDVARHRAPSARRAPSDRSRARPARRTLRGTSSRCRRTASSADRSAPSTDSRAARRRCASTAGPCGRCSCRPGTRASSVAGAAALRCRRPAAAVARRRRRATSPPRRRAAPPPAPAHRDVTVNGAVAREISTRCFCSTRSSSACAPGRGSSAGKHVGRRALRSSAFRIERLLFS